MKLKTIKSVKINEFEIFQEYSEDLVAAFSTRIGGVSSGIYESMNLSFYIGDDSKLVAENYKIFSNSVGVNYENLVFSAQEHNDQIKIVKKNDAGKGITRERDYTNIDGLLTNIKNIPLTTLHADCTPLFFYDPKEKVVGVAHAGWKGTTMEIAGKMIDEMIKEYNSVPENIKVAIGPAICAKCYEVGNDVKIELEKMSVDVSEFIKQGLKADKYYIDIANINKKVLENKGILKENIEMANTCTKENKELYFSHRESGRQRGTQATIIQLK